MPMVSKHQLFPEIEERIKELLLDAIAKITDKKEVEQLLNDFFTKTERIMFGKRLAIAVLLLKKYDFKSISKTLKVSSSTIMRVNYLVKDKNSYFYKLANRIIQKEQSEETSHNFWYSVESVSVTLQRGNWKERRAQIEKEHREFKRRYVI
jgi:uncharacterized protein YerC